MTEALKHDSGKLPYELLPPDAIREVVKVLQFGANKYAPRNWEKGFDYTRLIGAIKRHTADIELREDFDDETKLLHAAHLVCEALFLLTHQLRGIGRDDRPVLTYLQLARDMNAVDMEALQRALELDPGVIHTRPTDDEIRARVYKTSGD